MRKTIKSLIVLMILLVTLLCVTGCEIKIGGKDDDSKGKKESYKDLFPDAAAEKGSFAKSSNLCYKFTLGSYGEMLVYVDTSEGHKFELQNENGGFNILDKDGEIVLYVACIEKAGYQVYVADINDVKTINNRDFFYRENADGSTDVFSYMADCGLDCGMVMETKGDSDAFRLVAFRGNPIEGASSDIYAYKESSDGNDPVDTTTEDTDATEDIIVTEEETEETEDVTEDSGNTGATTNSSLDPDVKKQMDALDTDYSKINWGVQYSPFAEYPGFVISVAPTFSYGQYGLAIAFTNLYSDPVAFQGDATALASDGSEVGTTTVYTETLCNGNTVIYTILCEDMPDGRIHWENAKLDTDPYDGYEPWTADYSVTGNPSDGYLTVEYSMSSVNNVDIIRGTVVCVLIDSNGNIVDVAYDYNYDTIAAGEKAQGSCSVYNDEERLKTVADVAIFAAPAPAN